MDGADEMIPDLVWLESIAAVAHRGTYSRAAVDVRYSSSTVRHHVKLLERCVGTELLCFDDRGLLVPTVAGVVVLAAAESIASRWHQALSVLGQRAGDQVATDEAGASRPLIHRDGIVNQPARERR